MAQRIDYAALLRLRSEGLTASQIAARLGCCVDSVHRAATKFGLERRSSGKRPKLSDDEIRRRWNAGVPTQEIADACGVTYATLYGYARRMRLPEREKAERKRKTVDPTPAEIERLKAELREKHFAERRAEKDDYHREVMA